MIPMLVLFAKIVVASVAIAATADVLRGKLRDPHRRRRERALGMAGRLALPAPDDEQCRLRRAMLDATGRPDPTGMPGLGDDDGDRWDPIRCGWVRVSDGEFTPWRPRRDDPPPWESDVPDPRPPLVRKG